MKKNINLLYCILGSLFLVLLNSRIFTSAKLALWEGRGYGSSTFAVFFHDFTNVLSFIGIILLIIFSIALIIRNFKLIVKKDDMDK